MRISIPATAFSVLSIALPTALLSLGTMHAADHQDGSDFSVVRVEGSMLDKSYEYHASGSALGIDSNFSGSGTWDDAFRIGAVGTRFHALGDHNPIGFVSGLGLFYTRYDRDQNTKQKYEALSAQLRLGLGVAIADIVHLEVTPFGGIGAARGDIGGVKSGDPDLFFEYGAEAGAYATIADAFEIGVHGGWVKSRFDLKFDDSNEFGGAPLRNVRVKLDNEGFYYGASIGARF